MTRKNFFVVLIVVWFFSTATWAQVPEKEKVVAGAERGFEKFTKAYVGPAPGCAAAVSLNGETVFVLLSYCPCTLNRCAPLLLFITVIASLLRSSVIAFG
jgi:hypothetical protein